VIIEKSKVFCALLSIGMAVIWLIFTFRVIQANGDYGLETPSNEDNKTYLPLIQSHYLSPAGSYLCYEFEFGLIWLTEIITLNADGSSEYYGATAKNEVFETAVVTGTWIYTPSTQEVGFTNFRWMTATYESPNRLWAQEYLEYVGFEIALECQRR